MGIKRRRQRRVVLCLGRVGNGGTGSPGFGFVPGGGRRRIGVVETALVAWQVSFALFPGMLLLLLLLLLLLRERVLAIAAVVVVSCRAAATGGAAPVPVLVFVEHVCRLLR